jgi:hypothetical protein
MTADQLLASTPSLLRKLDAIRAALNDEAGEIIEQWQTLASMGVQRADHAAALLSRLRPHLTELQRFARNCEAQIDAVVRDPFGRAP